MRKQRRIKKEDIGDPSNFVHVKHVGFGLKSSPVPQQRSLDLGTSQDSSDTNEDHTTGTTGSATADIDELSEPTYQVERRNKGHRASLIPRHHRSTTTCIFPSENSFAFSLGNKPSIECHRESMESPVVSPANKSTLKPTFGSLLNLSFLPLGLGKASSKSPSMGKTKRMSLLNLTASNLFASPKVNYEENRESVHMTSYTRRRSLTNSNDENNDTDNEVEAPVKPPRSNQKVIGDVDSSTLKAKDSKPGAPTRIPLAKLGRSKSTMAEFAKRPKLRLKIVPPPQPPPPVPTPVVKNNPEAEALPSPPPSPIPSPPPSPVPAAMPFLEEVQVAVLRSPKSVQRPRIIPLPSTSSLDSVEPSSPQYLTPAGGSSPVPNNESSVPSLLSPTIPPSSTPFFSTSRCAPPGTPPVWPLQPVWPTPFSLQMKEVTIPEVPSPCKEEMEILENEYGPVLSIVESFISNGHENSSQVNIESVNESNNEDTDTTLHSHQHATVNASNISSISSILRENIEYTHWPRIAQKLFNTITNVPPQESVACSTTTENDVYGCLLTKTLELWLKKSGDEAVVEKLVTILHEENCHQATESLREVFGNIKI